MNIKRKVEAAFKAYLQTIPALSGLEISAGHEANAEGFPLLLVHCRQSKETPDLPPGTDEHNAELVLQLITQSDDEAVAPISDDRLADVTAAMRDLAAIQAALNCPEDVEDTDDDTRTVSGFHVKAVEAVTEDGATEDRLWIDSLEYSAEVCGFDV